MARVNSTGWTLVHLDNSTLVPIEAMAANMGSGETDVTLQAKKKTLLQKAMVHQIFQRRDTFGEFHHLIDEVFKDEDKGLSYIRMKPATFFSATEQS